MHLAIFSLAAPPPRTRITHPSPPTLYFIPNAPFGGPLTNTQRDEEGLASEVSCNDGIDGAVVVSSNVHPVVRPPPRFPTVHTYTLLRRPWGPRDRSGVSVWAFPRLVPVSKYHRVFRIDCISMARTNKINCFCVVPARRRVLATVAEKSERLIVNFDRVIVIPLACRVESQLPRRRSYTTRSMSVA